MTPITQQDSNSITEGFLARLPPHAPSGLRDDITAAFGIAGRFAERVAEIRADNKLSPAGKAEAVREVLRTGFGAHLKQLQEKTKRARDHVAAQRAGLMKLPPPDNQIVIMQQQEIRSWMRSLPEFQRCQIAVDPKTDPAIREAIIHALPALSGLTPDIHGTAVTAAVEAMHGPKLRELDDLEEAIANTDAAIQIAGMEMHRVSDLHERDFRHAYFGAEDPGIAA
jgi:hypothetical protein